MSRPTRPGRVASSLHTAFLLAVALGVACVEAPVYVAPDAPPARSVERVLLVPMNFDATPPTRVLVRGVEILQADLEAYLTELGIEVVSPRLIDVLRAWHRAAKAVGLSENDPPEVVDAKLARARAALVQALAEEHEVDVFVMPTLLVREGHYIGLELRWDGVTRAVPIEQQSGFQTVDRIAGNGQGTSLRVLLLSPSGELFFERYAGLEPLLRYTISGGGAPSGRMMAVPRRLEARPRTDLFQDPEVIREGVQLAFEPYLPVAEPEEPAP